MVDAMSGAGVTRKKTCTLCHFIGPEVLGDWDAQALVVFEDGTLDPYCQTAQPFLGWCIYRLTDERSEGGLPVYRLDSIGQSRQERGV